MKIETKFDIGDEVYCVSPMEHYVKKVKIKNIYSTYELDDLEEKGKKGWLWIIDEKDNCLFEIQEEAEQRLQEILAKESMK